MTDLTSLAGFLAPSAATGTGFPGVATAVVSNVEDPAGTGRVKVALPWLGEDVESPWARVAVPMAGSGRGLLLVPDVGDEVLVAFEHGSLDHPVVIGSLWSREDPPPAAVDGTNAVRMLRTGGGAVVLLDDSQGARVIEIADNAGNAVRLEADGGRLVITAAGDLELVAERGRIRLCAAEVEIDASTALRARSSGSAELSASGTTAVKGAFVELN